MKITELPTEKREEASNDNLNAGLDKMPRALNIRSIERLKEAVAEQGFIVSTNTIRRRLNKDHHLYNEGIYDKAAEFITDEHLEEIRIYGKSADAVRFKREMRAAIKTAVDLGIFKKDTKITMERAGEILSDIDPNLNPQTISGIRRGIHVDIYRELLEYLVDGHENMPLGGNVKGAVSENNQAEDAKEFINAEKKLKQGARFTTEQLGDELAKINPKLDLELYKKQMHAGNRSVLFRALKHRIVSKEELAERAAKEFIKAAKKLKRKDRFLTSELGQKLVEINPELNIETYNSMMHGGNASPLYMALCRHIISKEEAATKAAEGFIEAAKKLKPEDRFPKSELGQKLIAINPKLDIETYYSMMHSGNASSLYKALFAHIISKEEAAAKTADEFIKTVHELPPDATFKDKTELGQALVSKNPKLDIEKYMKLMRAGTQNPVFRAMQSRISGNAQR